MVIGLEHQEGRDEALDQPLTFRVSNPGGGV